MPHKSEEPVPIAIIGMGCRYPAGANSPEELWNVVSEGRSGWTEVPSDRFNHEAFYHPDPEAPGAINQKGGHFIDQDIAAFDPGFFGIPRPEAETLDPQQRVVLETSWEAVENAGIPMSWFKGSNTGVFVAMFGHDFDHISQKDPVSLSKYHNLGIARPLLANRVSYVFDLQGPSVMIDTACSGSLVAVNSACQSLRSGESRMALAGGVGLVFSPDQMSLMSMTGFFNDQGRSYTFDDRGNGYGRGEGVGIVALKRLDDAARDGDNIRAVIRSSGANSDGRTNGIMLPSKTAQQRLAKSLFEYLPFTPLDVHYAEAHGTGTKAGDDAEMGTIRNVFCEGRGDQNPIFVGATKPNLGHSEAASGVAGLIKTVMAMEKGMISPNILLERFKPGLEPDGKTLKVSQSLIPWPSTRSSRKAVVNSFGFGGTNTMVVLESSPYQSGSRANDDTDAVDHLNNTNTSKDEESRPRLFTLSATSEHSLQHAADHLRAYLKQHPDADLDDLSYTLTSRRSDFQWRSSIVAHSTKSLQEGLMSQSQSQHSKPPQTANVFIFTGQGAQSARMGYHLLSSQKNEFSRSIARSEKLLRDLGAKWSLVEELSREESTSLLNDSKYGQPASTAVQLALIDLLRSWKVHPAAVIGHSSGEIAAAYAVGALSQSAAMRVSYHRGFLAYMSKERNSRPGAMLAVSIGEKDAEAYIQKHGNLGAVVACINSPSSTTISGDANIISDLKAALDEDGIFARKLKVDTAYHSHHMASVGQDYLGLLQGLDSGSADPSIRFFSTVTGEEKTGGFDASYWVKNLVSPVRFSTALENFCQGQGRTALDLIEVGPHEALAGPVRQTMASLRVEGLSYTYIPTLIRKTNSTASLVSTGSNIFCSGGGVDVGAVATLGISKQSPAVLQDLPPYPWNHTTIHWTESRLSREHRFRKHAHHDLLGSRVVASPDSQPSWRLLLSIETLPWLKDHMIDGFIVYPGAAYMTMAIQAMQQINFDRRPGAKPKGYRLKNVSFKKTLTLHKDGKSVETVVSFLYSDTTETWLFTVSSISQQGKWQEHCDGTITAVFNAEHAETDQDQSQEEEFFQAYKVSLLDDARETCGKVVEHEALYAQMAATGNQYGPAFAINTESRMSSLQSLNTLIIPDILSTMPGKFMQPHVIHPTTFDAIIQACLPVYQQHSIRGSVMPVFMEDVYISTDILSQPSTQLEVLCDLSDTFPHSTGFSTATFQAGDDGNLKCVLTIDKGEIRVVGKTQSPSPGSENNNIYKLEWGIDSSSITPEMFESLDVHLQSTEAGMTQAEKVDLGSVACARYIDWAVREMRDNNLVVKDDHRVHWWRLLREFYDSKRGQSLIKRSPETKSELDQLTSRIGVEGEAIAKIGPELVPLLTGQTDPLVHFLEDDLIFRVYHSDEGARPNRYMAEYAKILTFQRRDLRILEFGAGTGGTTFQVLQACSPNGEDFCAEYMYTDISSGFFEAVRTTKLEPWAHLLTFQTLDLEEDAAEQGFEEYSYDLVIAANVVHATRSLQKSLRTIRRLLKPDGLLGLVELTRTTPYINMTFGSIPGWWAGVDEGRTDSPLQSVEQWHGHLQRAGFSGVDLAAYDLPEPERHCALLISSALAPTPTANGRLSRVKILDATPEGLAEHGFSGIDASSSYIIVDSSAQPLLRHAFAEQFHQLTSLLSQASKIYWISFATKSRSINPENALAVGVSRTARNENLYLDCFTIDVQDSFEQHGKRILQNLVSFIALNEANPASNQPREYELQYRDSEMRIQRLVPAEKLSNAIFHRFEGFETGKAFFHEDSRPLKISIGKPGLLNTLVFVDDEQGNIGPDEVEIKSYAWGVNFSDVFIALGQLPPTQPMVGESAGIITAVGSNFASMYKPGDRVVAMFSTPYASRARTNGHLIHRIPDSLSFTNAASITLTFATAYYSLFDCANLQQGQTILIHSASGALGQVAIKIAQRLGSTIFATAGSPSKRQLLVEQYGIPKSHIFSSRTTDFAQGVKRLTNGVGVDVVLNSLSGPMLQASWECVAPFGNFVEVGKTDIYRRSRLSMKPFEKNLRFSSVDLVKFSKQRPEYCQKLLQRIFADLEASYFTPLSLTTMPIGDIEKAFRLMQSRKHTGKIVLEATDDSTVLATVQPLRLRPDGTYIIVGGLGGMGKLICRHLQIKGARHIALFSRQNFEDSAKIEVENSLTDVPEAIVRVVTCDVADAEVVTKVAIELKNSMPPVIGIIHGGMVLSDHTISKITQEDFEITLRPKYQGTINIYEAFFSEDIDFFINLSSLCGIVGTLGQSNYAAGGTYQDMFTHAQVLAGRKNVFTIDLPLIKSTYSVTQEHTHSLKRQGVQLLPIEDALPVLDYVMSGKASRDGNHQIAFGLETQSFIDRFKNGGIIPPLLCHITSGRARGATKQTHQQKDQAPEEKIAMARTIEDAEKLVFLAVRDKIASLTALDTQELDFDPPIANLALDSLVATEIKNWIRNTLKAPIQTSDIMDAQSIRSLASFITSISSLVKKEPTTKPEDATDVVKESDKTNGGHQERGGDKEFLHPKYPLRSLKATLEYFFDSVGHLGSAEELQSTREAINAFLAPEGVGQRLQARLAKLSGELAENDEVVDMYVRNKWLRGRDWRPRLRNFFATLPRQDIDRRPQADQAAWISMAAYNYKKSIDDGTVRQDFYNGQALDMATVHWLFSSNRTPALGCDRVERFPESDYFVVMNRGHVYKVPFKDPKGETLEYENLRSIFLSILQETPREASHLSILTSADRDEWARARNDLITFNQSNHDYIRTVEECVFIINLEDAAPETATERADVFLLDDNSNRWLDKTLSFIVCANGVSSIWGEHTMVDGTTFDGLIKAISATAMDPETNGNAASLIDAVKSNYTYLPITLPPAMPEYITKLQAQHQAAHDGFTLANLGHTSYAAAYLRQRKLPPKSVIQLVVQIAVRRLFGYNPLGAVDVISQRPFRGGRTDMIYVMTPPVQAFCAAAEDPSLDAVRKRKLLLEAVKSHAKLMTMSTQGWGFRWHLMALREMLEPGEEAPVFYNDDVFTRSSERPVCTSFTEFGLPEMGRCQPHKKDVWVGVQVLENRVQFTVINGERKSEEFVEHLKKAAQVMKMIIEANADD